MKNYILTCSHMRFDLDNPEANFYHIRDIAGALSRICRFTGHTPKFYSVAQHCVLATQLVPPELTVETLLHDAQEAYIGDVSTPLKRLLPDYRTLENRIEAAIRRAFVLPPAMSPEVKTADIGMLAWEKQELLRSNDPWDVLEGVKVPNIDCGGELFWTPEVAERRFLEVFYEAVR